MNKSLLLVATVLLGSFAPIANANTIDFTCQKSTGIINVAHIVVVNSDLSIGGSKDNSLIHGLAIKARSNGVKNMYPFETEAEFLNWQGSAGANFGGSINFFNMEKPNRFIQNVGLSVSYEYATDKRSLRSLMQKGKYALIIQALDSNSQSITEVFTGDQCESGLKKLLSSFE